MQTCRICKHKKLNHEGRFTNIGTDWGWVCETCYVTEGIEQVKYTHQQKYNLLRSMRRGQRKASQADAIHRTEHQDSQALDGQREDIQARPAAEDQAEEE